MAAPPTMTVFSAAKVGADQMAAVDMRVATAAARTAERAMAWKVI
jgi:hypothetical protein